MVIVLPLDGDGKPVCASVERVASVRDAVGRKEDRQPEYMRAPPERIRLVRIGGAQNLDAQPRMGQAYEIGADRRHQQGRVVAFGELHGLQTVPVDAAKHPLEQLVDLCGQGLLGGGADLLIDLFPAFEEDDRRDVAP